MPVWRRAAGSISPQNVEEPARRIAAALAPRPAAVLAAVGPAAAQDFYKGS